VTPPRPSPTSTYVTTAEFERRVSELKQSLQIIDGHILNVEEIVTKIGSDMAADFTQLDADLNTLATGFQAQAAQIVALQNALNSADADKAAAVAAAIAADDATDQAAVDAADAVAQGVLNPPASS
jgi:chromosome segregation ATPase